MGNIADYNWGVDRESICLLINIIINFIRTKYFSCPNELAWFLSRSRTFCCLNISVVNRNINWWDQFCHGLNGFIRLQNCLKIWNNKSLELNGNKHEHVFFQLVCYHWTWWNGHMIQNKSVAPLKSFSAALMFEAVDGVMRYKLPSWFFQWKWICDIEKKISSRKSTHYRGIRI